MKIRTKSIFFVGICLLLTSMVYAQVTKTGKGTKQSPVFLAFHGTTDKSFCSPDSLIGSDCIGGDIYLTAKGNVIYVFYCCCDNPDVYSTGTYKVKGDSIVCNFQKDYVVENNKRSISVNKWSLVLKQINCPTYKYYFTESYEEEGENGNKQRKEQTYVVTKTSKADNAELIKTISKIKQLKDL